MACYWMFVLTGKVMQKVFLQIRTACEQKETLFLSAPSLPSSLLFSFFLIIIVLARPLFHHSFILSFALALSAFPHHSPLFHLLPLLLQNSPSASPLITLFVSFFSLSLPRVTLVLCWSAFITLSPFFSHLCHLSSFEAPFPNNPQLGAADATNVLK